MARSLRTSSNHRRYQCQSRKEKLFFFLWMKDRARVKDGQTTRLIKHVRLFNVNILNEII